MEDWHGPGVSPVAAGRWSVELMRNRIARGFRLDDHGWRRHANPWSVWTRVVSIVPLVLAAWSWHWIGAYALLALAACGVWLWLNPRLFPPPARTDSWASQVTFGERLWLARGPSGVPAHHRTGPRLLEAVSATGVPLAIYGIAVAKLWPTLAGCILVLLGKLWFCDRMVWLYRDVAAAEPETARQLDRHNGA
jgi:hypothetical protein